MEAASSVDESGAVVAGPERNGCANLARMRSAGRVVVAWRHGMVSSTADRSVMRA